MVRRILKAEKKPTEESKGKYVYCVIKAPEERKSFGQIGFEGSEVYTFEYKDLTPVVSDVTMREYQVSEEEVEPHRKVVERIMNEHSVLPVAYGMIFKNRKLLQIAMGAGYAAMKKAFVVVDDKVELGIKIFLPGEMEESRKAQCRSEFMAVLKEIADDQKDLKLFSARLIMNSAFLVNSSRVDRFSEAVGELTSKYSDVKVQYSGPWPAYNFVDIHILGNKRKGFR